MIQPPKWLTWSRLRLTYFTISAIAFLLTELGRKVYRPFVNQHAIYDWGIADTMGNHLGTITQIFFILGVIHASRREGLIIIAIVVPGYVLYECVQAWLPRSTFDWKDILATLVGSVLALPIFIFVHKFGREPNASAQQIEENSQ